MTVSVHLRELYERFWRDHFARLDNLAPHPKDSRAFVYHGARKISSFTCKDGILFAFANGPLAFEHKSSGLTVQAKLNKLTDPVGLGFKKFPDWFDLGPLQLGEGVRGVPAERLADNLPVFIPRIVWFLTGFADLNSGVARRLANDAHARGGRKTVFAADLPSTFKLPGET